MRKTFIVFVAIVLLLFFAKDAVIKSVFEGTVKNMTGLKLHIVKFRVGLFEPVVNIAKLRLLNPIGYVDRIMADVPEIRIIYDLETVTKKNLRLRRLFIHITELTVVKNKKGEINLNHFKVIKARKEGQVLEDNPKLQKIIIDFLRLKIGKVVYKDYSKGKEPVVKEYKLDIDETYSGIKDVYSLARVIIVRALANTGISRRTNIPVRDLRSAVSDVLSTCEKSAGREEIDNTEGIGSVFQRFFSRFKEVKAHD